MFPFERRAAELGYRNWSQRLGQSRPETLDENQRTAMNAGLTAAGVTWAVLWLPLILADAAVFSTSHLATLVLSLAAIFPMSMTFIRIGQSARFSPTGRWR